MVLSVRRAAVALDPLYPSHSVRDLLSRFRYLGTDPGQVPSTASVKAAISRLEENTPSSLLHLNCWLLESHFDLRYVIDASFGGPLELAVCAGIAGVELLTQVLAEMTSSEICDKIFPPILSLCGVSIDPLNDACKLVHDAAELATWILSITGKAVAEIISILNVPSDLVFKVVSHILFLDHIFISPKPDLDDRAFEIGAAVSGYDIISLVEVWEEKSQNKILAFGSELNKDSDGNFQTWSGRYFKGPENPLAGSYKQLGSGIFVVVPQLACSDGGHHAYVVDGVSRPLSEGCDFGALVDVDRLANKGVQHTVITLPGGVGIDLYTTHLSSGGDGIEWGSVIGLPPPTPKEKAATRLAQVGELCQFIHDTHDASRVAMVVGDFNIDAYADGKDGQRVKSAEYQNLVAALGQVPRQNGLPSTTLYDLWSTSFGTGSNQSVVSGGTNRSGEDGDPPVEHDYSRVCSNGAFVSSVDQFVSGTDMFCREDSYQSGGSRIDFIFVEVPQPQHAMNLDVSRIRRRQFERANPGKTAYLSDHLGLELTLYTSRRR